MAPGILSDIPVHSGNAKTARTQTPLKKSGALDKFAHEETTPVIGREFPKLNIVDDILNASNADELLRDLAITSELPQKTNWSIYTY